VLRKIYLDAVHPVHNIVTRISSHIHMFASENLANLIIFISLSQHLALWRLIILKVQYVKSSTLVSAASRCLLLQSLHLFSFSLALIVHKLPTLQVTLILLNPI
jgi:hypothetical protein